MNRRPAWYRSRKPKAKFHMLGTDPHRVSWALKNGLLPLEFLAVFGSKLVPDARITIWIDGERFERVLETSIDGHATFFMSLEGKSDCVHVRVRCEFPDKTALDIEEKVLLVSE